MKAVTAVIIFALLSHCFARETQKTYAQSGELKAYQRDSNGDGKYDIKYNKIVDGSDGVERFDYDRNGDGIFEETRELEYFQGRLSREVVSLGRTTDRGRYNERRTSTYLLSKNKVSVFIEKDQDRDGNFESFTSAIKDDLPSH